MFRLDCGTGPGVVRSASKIHLDQWNHLSVFRHDWAVWIQLNGGHKEEGRSQVRYRDGFNFGNHCNLNPVGSIFISIILRKRNQKDSNWNSKYCIYLFFSWTYLEKFLLQGLFSRITFNQALYLGGVGDIKNVKNFVGLDTGLNGCIRRLEINDKVYDLIPASQTGDIIAGQDISKYSQNMHRSQIAWFPRNPLIGQLGF